MTRPVYLALVHHPVRDREGATVTTAITNLDVHDIARSARTYELAGYFVVTPIDAQQAIVRTMLRHWLEGAGGKRVPARMAAMQLVRPVATLADAEAAIAAETGSPPRRVVTAARADGVEVQSFADEARAIAASDRPTLLLFGTGYGLAEEVLAAADARLAPIRPGGYNHLSVRAAVAIALDRLFGDERVAAHVAPEDGSR
ncbi:MAG: RNA methyltransferase [Myxococcales bacterium]|nr:RNA methyltransferase [Myxococcales bacterium]